jgi:hypothetical protein
MTLDNVIFPEPFKLSNRNPHGVTSDKQAKLISNFQLALFESAKRASHGLKQVIVPQGEKVLRSVKDRFSNMDARKVPPGASMKTDVRWSGLIAGTNVCRGALYTSQDTKGFLNEARRYSRAREIKEIPWTGGNAGTAKYTVFGPASEDYRQLLVGQTYYTFVLKDAISVADLTPASSSNFYTRIDADRGYQAAKRDLRVQPDLWKLVFDPVDYTASRPVGLSVLLGSQLSGIRVISAQSEVPELPGSGHNLVLGGEDGKDIAYLRPTGQLIAGTSNHRPALIEISFDGINTNAGTILRGSVLKTSTD